MEPAIVYYHKDCPDGFGSAWWLSKFLDRSSTVFRPIGYDETPNPKDIDGIDVFVVDFCFDTPTLEMVARYAKTVLVLDHHKTAAGWLAAARSYEVVETVAQLGHGRCRAVCNMDSSGVGLTIDYVASLLNTTAPRFLRNIEDRDLWRFHMLDTREVFAAVTSYPQDFEVWDRLECTMHSDLEHQGEAIERYRDQLIESIVKTAYVTTICGHDVWIASSPFAVGSDVAGELAKRRPEHFGAYYVDYGKKVRYGLRSTPTGLDVAELAAIHGGGGHKHAAGFEIERTNLP